MIPLVSIWIITYNHIDYISNALDGILTQKVNFDFEIVIGDDASTDNTQEIILQYQKKHPNIIRPILHNKNVGMMKNMVLTLENCKGKYIALCEGDDYWIDPQKLQRQIEFMEDNSNCTLCFTNRIEISTKNIIKKETQYDQKKYSTHDILKGFIPPTQTILIRNLPDLTNFLNVHLDSPSGDRLLAFFCSLMGDIEMLPIYSAAYRQSGTGVWNHLNSSEQFIISLERLIQFHKSIGLPSNNELIHQRVNGSIIYLIKKNNRNSLKSIIKIFRLKKLYRIKSHFLSYIISKVF